MKNIKEQKVFMEYPQTRVRYQKNQKAENMPYMHYHECYEVYIMLDGCVNYSMPDASYEMNNNSFILINPFTVHRKKTVSASYTTFLLNFNVELLEEYFTPEAVSRIISPFSSIQYGTFDENTASKIKNLASIMTKSKTNADTSMGIAEIMNILKNSSYESKIDIPSKTSFEKDLYTYVASNLDKKITLDTISADFYISKQALISQFKKDSGVTPMCYVNKTKMEFAKLMLTYPEFSIERISFFCGYQSLSYFSKIFNDFFGETPLKYRKRVLNNEFQRKN